MRKITLAFGLLLTGLALNSCSSSTGDAKSLLEELAEEVKVKYIVKKVNGLYSVDIPDFMTETTTLQPDASLQYNNPFKEKYITVLDETKEDVEAFISDYGVGDDTKSALENYSSMRLQYLAESGITVKNQTKLKSSMINGRKALSTTIDATVPGIVEDITYYFTYIEGSDHFYMISAWTLFSLKDTYSEEVKVMSDSFKEL
jgi:hypothetical protein